MKVKLKVGKTLPRMICIPGMDKVSFRKLQSGGTVDVNAESEFKLIGGGYCEAIPIEKKGSADHGHGSID